MTKSVTGYKYNKNSLFVKPQIGILVDFLQAAHSKKAVHIPAASIGAFELFEDAQTVIIITDTEFFDCLTCLACNGQFLINNVAHYVFPSLMDMLFM